jgi:hypothetical protein
VKPTFDAGVKQSQFPTAGDERQVLGGKKIMKNVALKWVVQNKANFQAIASLRETRCL